MTIDYERTIIKIRLELSLSQEAFAKLLGVSFQTVNRWENGHFEPTKISKAKIENILHEHGIEPERKE